jgi:peptidoglycan/LPS O-acetylase OafA/YrhL
MPSIQPPSTPLAGPLSDLRRPTLASALRQPHLAGLDALRAVAVLLVLIDHSGLTNFGTLRVLYGGLGVEIFFVLSGFLITWLLLGEVDRHGRIDLGAFYWRRATRLLPAMLVYLVVGALLLLAMGKPLPWPAITAYALYAMNYYQGLTGAEPHYLSHAWSLAVEEQFYLLWPALLIVLLRRGWSLRRSLAGLILSLWAVKAVWVLVLGVGDDYLYRALETRADQLFMGCLLAVVLRSGDRWHAVFDTLARHRWLAGALVLALLATTALLQADVTTKYLIGYAVEPLLIAVLLPLVLVEARRAGWVARAINAPVVVLIGQVSYGIYLYHPFLIHPVRNAVLRLTGSMPLAVGLSLLLVLAVAWASFRWIETPLRHHLNGKLSRGATPTRHGSPQTSEMPEGMRAA